MNWDDFEEMVRSSVDDELAEAGDYSTATWSLEDLVHFSNLALPNYSRHFPQESIHEVTVVSGTKEYSLPTDIVTPPHQSIMDARWQRTSSHVEHLSVVRWRPGSTETITPIGANLGVLIWGNSLYLEKVPNDIDAIYPIELFYHAIHTAVPDDPSEFTFTVPDADMECIFWYVTSLMMMKLEAGDATLRQYADDEELGSSRDDSPPRRSAMYRMRMYQECIKARLAHQVRPRLRRVKR